MSEKERTEALEAVRSPEVRVICTAEALNAGYDLPEIDAAIALSYASSGIASVQTLGRTLRKKDGKKAAFFNLYAKETQEEKWLRAKLRVIEGTKISWPSQLNYVRYG